MVHSPVLTYTPFAFGCWVKASISTGYEASTLRAKTHLAYFPNRPAASAPVPSTTQPHLQATPPSPDHPLPAKDRLAANGDWSGMLSERSITSGLLGTAV